ncbi:MAG: sodium-dependent bicarbonate transport family permease [Bacteroidetes bacterium]|nr:sodium-dependent bicarbonate transport family permease [Bacteroidota bacterium]MBX7047283.1 sodium-dependent bicarbonate transport family permease [Ignavibacteria bacterium]
MHIFDSLIGSLLSPMVLAFALGILATLIKSDLKFPDGLYAALTIYLLFAIGLKGGYKLSQTPIKEFILPALFGLLLGVMIPIWMFFILKKFGKFDYTNAAAIAAHYGSVSAVTFGEGIAFLDLMKIPYEGYMPTLLAVMEIPGIIVALLIARKYSKSESSMGRIFHELFTNKGTVLLIGGLVIGFVSGNKGHEQIAPLFETLFRGMLTLFLLEIGLVTGRKLADLKKVGSFLVAFGIVMPIVNAVIGILCGKLAGLGVGGCTMLGVLASSASYIAAPAAVRIALPEANPTYYLTSALAITFPFNVTIGLPLYFSIANFIVG